MQVAIIDCYLRKMSFEKKEREKFERHIRANDNVHCISTSQKIV